MNDGIEILDAKQYFEELQRVMVSFPKEYRPDRRTFLRAYDTGRTVVPVREWRKRRARIPFCL